MKENMTELTLMIQMQDEIARAIAEELGMDMMVEHEVEVGEGEHELHGLEEDEDMMFVTMTATKEDVDSWLEHHMKQTITNTYAKVVEDLKLKQLDAMREAKANEIKRDVGSAISVGSNVKKS